MKIMYITDTLALWGGIERVLSCKANELAEHYGYHVRFVTTNQGHHPLLFHLAEGVSHVDLDIRFHRQYEYGIFKRIVFMHRMKRLFKIRLRNEIDQFEPDVVVLITLKYASIVRKVVRDIPLMVESHSSFNSDLYDHASLLSRMNTSYNRRCLKRASGIVALTEKDAKNWQAINPRCFVIPNIVQLNDTGIYSDCRSNHAIFVGRFTHQKDIDSLLAVWVIVNRKHPDWHLDLYGDGELKVYYQEKIDKMNINIHVHHPESSIFQRYIESSMLLLTSLYEPFGLVLPEAMSCGLPVVAFDCPYGPADIITDGVDGFLIKDRDIEAFADRVCQLIESEELRCQMGKQGVVSSQRYRADRIMPMWNRLFQELAAHASSPKE